MEDPQGGPHRGEGRIRGFLVYDGGGNEVKGSVFAWHDSGLRRFIDALGFSLFTHRKRKEQK
jgi:hypothetical protein